ncbi:glycosyltransferase family 2 protein [Geoglobus acetivorans]|nr:glycosyltransferase family 2 protein [Geoglobus acetivorans]
MKQENIRNTKIPKNSASDVRKRIAVIIPVSVFEPAETLRDCAEYLNNLDFGEMECRIVFSFDGDESDDRVRMLRKYGFLVLARNTRRGKRAGAINDALDHLVKFKPDFVAILDVDSRPERGVIPRCAEAVGDGIFIASARRRISNPVNSTTRAVEFEYRLIGYLLKHSGFRQFNGLIGVLDGSILFRHRLNEDALTEDADFSTRMHCLGLKAELVDGFFYEQSPLTWRDFFEQRKRWYYGGLELWKYLPDVLKSGNVGFITSWISALTLTFFPSLFIPFILLSLPSLLVYYGKDGFETFSGFIVYSLVLQAASISAIFNFLRNKGVEWKAVKRMEQLKS